LSKTTEAHDRGFKFAQYQRLESLREYVLVSQWEPRIEVFRRLNGAEWLLTSYASLDKSFRIDSFDCEIPLTVIYRDVEFAAASAETPPA
jgi:Uma2 family endonuclease